MKNIIYGVYYVFRKCSWKAGIKHMCNRNAIFSTNYCEIYQLEFRIFVLKLNISHTVLSLNLRHTLYCFWISVIIYCTVSDSPSSQTVLSLNLRTYCTVSESPSQNKFPPTQSYNACAYANAIETRQVVLTSRWSVGCRQQMDMT